MDIKPIPFDEDRACGEGWGLFDVTDGYGAPRYEICCEDEETFADDLEARAFVLNSAMDGSQYHRDALAIVLGLHTPAKVPAVTPAAPPMDLALAQAALDVWGLNAVTREALMNTDFEVRAFTGAPSMTPAQRAEAHSEIRAEWRERASEHPGAFAVYDPNSDAEGWMLVGDDLAALVRESVQHHEDIQL